MQPRIKTRSNQSTPLTSLQKYMKEGTSSNTKFKSRKIAYMEDKQAKN